MTPLVSALKLEPIIVQAYPNNSGKSKNDIIFIKPQETNEQKYEREKEFKLREEFNEFLYESYYKRGIKPDDYIKNKLWITFKFNKKRNESGLLNYLEKLWEKFEDDYFN